MNQLKPLPLRKQQKNYTRQRLIDVARELFAQNGIQNTGIDDIAKAAGTSRATVYTHFGGKPEIIREMVADMWETSLSLCEEFGALKEWSYPVIRAWIGEVFERAEKNAETTRMVLREAPSAVSNESQERLIPQVEAVMANRALWGHFTPDEGRRRARLLVILLFRGLFAHQNGTLDTTQEPLLDTLADIWTTTLRVDQIQRKA